MDWDGFLRVLKIKESGGQPNDGYGAIGDAGKALGPLQIWRTYWQDVADRVGGSYEDCAGLEYSRRVVRAYMERWASDALASGDWEALARIHNGGLNGASKPATDGYWRAFKRIASGMEIGRAHV